MYKINEIFYSLQGEGYWTGNAVIFIRFSGCNKQCSFCDTDFETFKEYSLPDILGAINNYSSNIIVLTGGEPALQVDQKLIDFLRKYKDRIHIETNGSIDLFQQFDWITVSPKDKYFHQTKGDELKLLYDGSQDLDWYFNNTNFKHYYLQPIKNNNYNYNLKEAIKIIKVYPKWKLSLQTHKLINIR